MPPQNEAKRSDVVYVDSAAALHLAVHKLRQRPLFESRAVDTETTGARPYFDRLKVVQIAVRGLPIYVLQIERIPQSDWAPLREYLAESRPNVLQNAKFDLKMLSAEDLPLNGRIKDTCLRSKLLHLGDSVYSHDLASIVYEHLKVKLDKDEQKKFVGDESRAPLTTKQITYCAADVEFLEALIEIITAKIERKDQFEGSKIVARVQREEGFLPLLAALELRGFSVNEDALTELEQDVKLRLETIEKVLVGLLRPNLKQLKLNFGKPVAFIPTKFTEQDLQTAFQLEAGTETELLKGLVKMPQIALALEHRVLLKQLALCQQTVAGVNPVTGRLHPQHNQSEKMSGVMSGSRTRVKPLENLAQSYRKVPLCLLQVNPDQKLLRVSFPELELRLLAFYSQEAQLLEDFAKGVSPTRKLMQALADANVKLTPYERKPVAEAFWHGLGILNIKHFYLRQWLYAERGLICSPSVTKTVQNLLARLYPGLSRFHAEINKRRYQDRCTLLGGLRWWKGASDRDVRHFLVWGSSDEILKTAVGTVEDCPEGTNRIVFLNQTSFYVSSPADQSKALAEQLELQLSAQLTQTFPHIAIAVQAEIIPKFATRRKKFVPLSPSSLRKHKVEG